MNLWDSDVNGFTLGLPAYRMHIGSQDDYPNSLVARASRSLGTVRRLLETTRQMFLTNDRFLTLDLTNSYPSEMTRE